MGIGPKRLFKRYASTNNYPRNSLYKKCGIFKDGGVNSIDGCGWSHVKTQRQRRRWVMVVAKAAETEVTNYYNCSNAVKVVVENVGL